MFEPIEIQGRTLSMDDVWSDVERVCRRIPPLWSLDNFVAVNPFLGFTGSSIDRAAQQIGDALGAKVLPDVDYYRERWASGDFGPDDLARSAAKWGESAEILEAILEGQCVPPTRSTRPTLTFAERHDRAHAKRWEDAVVRQITRWCAVYAQGGGTYWGLPEEGRGLYASWREAAIVDRTLEILGLSGWRQWVKDLPESADKAIVKLFERLGVSPEDRENYLYHLLAGVYGWASYLRRDDWAQGDRFPTAVAELLAIRVCADAAVAELVPHADSLAASSSARIDGSDSETEVEDESIRLLFQEALEDAYVRDLLGTLRPVEGRTGSTQPAVQAVFCIDVRSEPLRRHLESQSAEIETRGFAGFFGVSLDWHSGGKGGSARCPVLLKPAVTVRSAAPASSGNLKAAAKQIQAAPAGAFNFVELLGLGYGLGLAADALTARATARPAEGTVPLALAPDGQGAGIARSTRLDLAAGILKNMGLRERFARLVLLCGHEGQSANNPHAAGLDCGACGGHGGALNARVAAALLNDPQVRQGLRDRAWSIPDDTLFAAGVHDTSSDEVSLLDLEGFPATHQKDLEQLRGWLLRAGVLTRAERARALGLKAGSPGSLLQKLRSRARDWSEVRPEWGLARNAAFIAARRARTRGVNLQGRTFLHEYDCALDPDNSILTLILSAPMVVASWINLQYFASTVDNRFFGCGTKTLHNRVGSLGVVLGNGGDLRTGLAIQSVHSPDGRWFHEPIRLQVIVEAEPERIEEVLTAQPKVRELVENGWVRLFALDPNGREASVRLPAGEWEPATGFEPAADRGALYGSA